MARRALLISASVAGIAVSKETPGCFFYPFAAPTLANPHNKGIYRYRDPAVETYVLASDAVACQALCSNQTNCTVFTFFDNTKGCWLQGPGSTLNVTMNGDYFGAGTIAGPKECPEVPDRCGPLAVASSGFPVTVDSAFPDQYQPRKGVCWKSTRLPGSIKPIFDRCTPTKVLHYTSGCQYPQLAPTPLATLQSLNKTCRDLCDENVECASYSETPEGCYRGIGLNCTVLPTEVNASGARLIRGATRKVFSWLGMKFRVGEAMMTGFQPRQDFRKAFDVSGFPSLEAAAEACRGVCESYLNCEFWQLSSQAGCFVDTSDSDFQLAYPLTAANFALDDATIIAGGFIQHICGLPLATPAPLPAGQVLAHITLEAKSLDFNAITQDKLGLLSVAYAEKIALWVGVSTDAVLAMDGRPRAVTIGAVPWKLSARRLQAESASTFIDTRIRVPATQNIEQVATKFTSNAKLFDDLKASTELVLGATSAAILPGLQFLTREEPHAVPDSHPSTWADSKVSGSTRSSTGLPWWVWLVIAIGALLVVAGIGALLVGACDKDKKKKSKSGRKSNRDVEAAEEEGRNPVEVPLVAPGAESD